MLFEGWLSHQKTYDRNEREQLEKTQFENPEARNISLKPLITEEDAIVWRRHSFMRGCSWIIIGFLLQIIAAIMSGTFLISNIENHDIIN